MEFRRRRLPRGLALMTLAPILFAFGCSLTRPTLHARRVDTVLRPNRRVETRTLWAGTKPLTVTLRQPSNPDVERVVHLRAVHDGNSLSILALWPDSSEIGEGWSNWVWDEWTNQYERQGSTRSERRSWIWDNSAGEYYLSEIPTDFFAFKFCISGSPEACMLNGEEGTYDTWTWRAGWTHVFGYAEDRKLIISHAPPETGHYEMYPAGDLAPPIYLQWKDDEGIPPYAFIPRPERYREPVLDGLRAQQPSGSSGDVLAEAIYYDRGTWMLEVKRDLRTGHADDYQFKGRGPHPFAIALSDESEGQSHFTSELIYLSLD